MKIAKVYCLGQQKNNTVYKTCIKKHKKLQMLKAISNPLTSMHFKCPKTYLENGMRALKKEKVTSRINFISEIRQHKFKYHTVSYVWDTQRINKEDRYRVAGRTCSNETENKGGGGERGRKKGLEKKKIREKLEIILL